MRTFRARGQDAVGIDILSSPFTDYVGNICDRDFVKARMRGVRAVIHTATLHKPHVATHTKSQFIETNVLGSLTLLEEAVAAGVDAFVYMSTTSAFGAALTPAIGDAATWIIEDVPPIPKNIYGVTKIAGEELCELFFRQERLPVIVLRLARFFPEEDDNAEIATAYTLANVQANETLYRRVDIADAVSATMIAIERARQVGFGKYIISATTPFTREDLPELNRCAPEVVRRLYPSFDGLYAARGWSFFPQIDRVYVNHAAAKELGWRPAYDFQHILTSLRANVDFRSPLSREVGSKGYHRRRYGEPG
jgi:UDP-glucose 4-epimerase